MSVCLKLSVGLTSGDCGGILAVASEDAMVGVRSSVNRSVLAGTQAMLVSGAALGVSLDTGWLKVAFEGRRGWWKATQVEELSLHH